MHSYSDLSVLTTPSDAMDVELQETGEQKSWYYYEPAKICVRLLIIGLFMCTTDCNEINIFFNLRYTYVYNLIHPNQTHDSTTIVAAESYYSNKTFNNYSNREKTIIIFIASIILLFLHITHWQRSALFESKQLCVCTCSIYQISGHTVFNLFCVDQKLPCNNFIARGLMVQYFITLSLL